MKSSFLLVPFALLLGTAAVSASGTLTNVRQLGDDAFRAGDYPSAAGFYRRALDSAAGSDEWAADALKLGEALLGAGDLAGANGILNEFRKRYPASSAGLLPGRIMAAEGKYEEAESFFNNIIDSAAASSAERYAAGFAAAQLLLRTGSPAEALKYFEALENDPGKSPVPQCRTARIYALILSGRLAEAETMLGNLADDNAVIVPVRELELLDLALTIARGDNAAFAEKWQKLRSTLHPGPDFMIYNTLNQGAEAALRAGKSETALQIWQDAFNFASGDHERRDTLHRIFNIYAGTDPQRAADTAMEYRRFFPAAPDRAQLLTAAARLMAAAGDSKRALELYESIITDKEVLREERSDAARDAAATAERNGDHQTARRMMEVLNREAASTAERHDAALLFGEYLLRQKQYKEVIQKVRGAVSSSVSKLSDRASYILLQALIGDGRDKAALAVAESLRSSKDPDHAAFAAFHAARLTGELGDKKRSREDYLKFTAAFAASQYAPEAAFSAARLAGELGEFLAASREFRDFAVRYPDDPSSPLALYHGVRCATLAEERHLAREILTVLTSRYPETPARGAALLCLAGHLRNRRYYDDELKLLAETAKVPVAPEFRPGVKLEEARIKADRRDLAGAAAAAEAMLEEFPASPAAADAAMLAGNMRSDLGEYARAGELFARALNLRPAGIFGDIANGRIADCAFALYGSTRRDEELVKAAGIYRKLAGSSAFPEIRIQSYFKSGECRAFTGDIAGAVSDYRQVLRCAAVMQKNGGSPDPVWSSRAAHLALQLLLDSDLPARLQLAEEIIREYSQLGSIAAADTEFDALRNEIKKRYLNRER